MVTQEELQNMSPEQIAELQKQNCIFCKIIKGEIPSSKVFSDSKVTGVLDINPAQKGHTLLMPNEHIPILQLLPKEDFEYLTQKTQLVSQAVREGTLATGTQIFIANGAAAGQQSPHFLLHIIPNDGSAHVKIPEKKIEGQKELAEKLKQKLGITAEEKPIEKQSKHELLATFLQTNNEARQMIIENPEQAKQLIEQDPQAKILFEGVDLNKLSEQLKRMSQ